MKKQFILGITLSAMFLASCANRQIPGGSIPGGSAPSDASAPSTPSDPSTPSEAPAATEWKASEVATMERLLGEAIPFIELDSGYELSVEEDDDGEYIYICSEGDGDLTGDYTTILDDADDYEFYSVDDDYGYDIYMYRKEVDAGDLFVQYDYFPGNSQYAACFEIYAWIDGGSSGEIDYEVISDWSDADKALFIEYLSEVIPLAPLSADYTCEWDEDYEEIYIFDEKGGAAAQTVYENTLAELEWECEEGLFGYTFYKDLDSDPAYYIGISCMGFDGYGFMVEAYVGKNPSVSDSFPTEDLAAWCTENGITASIPSFEAASYTYLAGTAFAIAAADDDGAILTAYQASLEAAGWTTEYDEDEDEYYATIATDDGVYLDFYDYEGYFYLYVIVSAAE